MALSPLQKIEAFNINTELQKDMSKLMQNTLCLPISAAYVAATKVLNAFVGPVALMKKQIVSALDNNPVTKALTDASKILNIVNANIGLPTLQISAQGLDAMNIFKTICLDFDDILPNAMKKLISNAAAAVNDGYHDMLDSADEMYDMPDEMVDMVDDAMLHACKIFARVSPPSGCGGIIAGDFRISYCLQKLSKTRRRH